MVDWNTWRQALLAMKGRRRIKGIAAATESMIEKETGVPTLKVLDRWLTACGTTIPEFFAQFVERETNTHYIPGHDDFYKLVADIIRTNDPGRIETAKNALGYMLPQSSVVDLKTEVRKRRARDNTAGGR